ncbi:unnamed protein product [marine sediment metagenome]|uniref:Uncharacterized protein n=1 Tax=marine sediment metagenome TaxID=412755 RepID=X0TRD4_9ZZZZ
MPARDQGDKKAMEDEFNELERCNNLSLIELQDNAYDLGYARGVADADEAEREEA